MGKPDFIAKLETCLQAAQPSAIELQYLMKGFGYSVYKEGFDVRTCLSYDFYFHKIVIHWAVQPEETMNN